MLRNCLKVAFKLNPFSVFKLQISKKETELVAVLGVELQVS